MVHKHDDISLKCRINSSFKLKSYYLYSNNLQVSQASNNFLKISVLPALTASFKLSTASSNAGGIPNPSIIPYKMSLLKIKSTILKTDIL